MAAASCCSSSATMVAMFVVVVVSVLWSGGLMVGVAAEDAMVEDIAQVVFPPDTDVTRSAVLIEETEEPKRRWCGCNKRLLPGQLHCVPNKPNIRGVLETSCCFNMTCPFSNGVCCDKGSHCCPFNTICVQGDPGTPPGCLHIFPDVKPSDLARSRNGGSSGGYDGSKNPKGRASHDEGQNGARPLPDLTKAVYEDPFAPTARNAFAKYKIAKVVMHHDMMSKMCNSINCTKIDFMPGFHMPPHPGLPIESALDSKLRCDWATCRSNPTSVVACKGCEAMQRLLKGGPMAALASLGIPSGAIGLGEARVMSSQPQTVVIGGVGRSINPLSTSISNKISEAVAVANTACGGRACVGAPALRLQAQAAREASDLVKQMLAQRMAGAGTGAGVAGGASAAAVSPDNNVSHLPPCSAMGCSNSKGARVEDLDPYTQQILGRLVTRYGVPLDDELVGLLAKHSQPVAEVMGKDKQVYRVVLGKEPKDTRTVVVRHDDKVRSVYILNNTTPAQQPQRRAAAVPHYRVEPGTYQREWVTRNKPGAENNNGASSTSSSSSSSSSVASTAPQPHRKAQFRVGKDGDGQVRINGVPIDGIEVDDQMATQTPQAPSISKTPDAANKFKFRESRLFDEQQNQAEEQAQLDQTPHLLPLFEHRSDAGASALNEESASTSLSAVQRKANTGVDVRNFAYALDRGELKKGSNPVQAVQEESTFQFGPNRGIFSGPPPEIPAAVASALGGSSNVLSSKPDPARVFLETDSTETDALFSTNEDEDGDLMTLRGAAEADTESSSSSHMELPYTKILMTNPYNNEMI